MTRKNIFETLKCEEFGHLLLSHGGPNFRSIPGQVRLAKRETTMVGLDTKYIHSPSRTHTPNEMDNETLTKTMLDKKLQFGQVCGCGCTPHMLPHTLPLSLMLTDFPQAATDPCALGSSSPPCPLDAGFGVQPQAETNHQLHNPSTKTTRESRKKCFPI